MPASTHRDVPAASTQADRQALASAAGPIQRLAVGVNGFAEGLDAAALGAVISRATGAAMMLVAVHPDPMVVVPTGLDWTSLHQQARKTLAETRDAFAPQALLELKTGHSVARALHRTVMGKHQDLLVMGSSRQAPEGRVRIGKRTRQLLCNFECALAVAPRGLHAHRDFALRRIGVGYDGSPESAAALAWAGAIAAGAGAEIRLRCVVDDRMPTVGWGDVWVGDIVRDWMAVVREEKESLRDEAQAAANRCGIEATPEVVSGRPADALLALSGEVDLIVIGSRRWGPVKRVLLGSTGEALMHDAACAVVAVPRPE
jgi:nucleotide-binding universal stress UspA family protein